MIKKIIITAFLAASVLQAANYFPIAPGNHWTYRAESGETFEIAVGLTPIMTNGNVYHKVTGYATQPLYLRRGDDGVIYWLNEEAGREEIMTNFEPVPGGYSSTPISAPCAQEAAAQEKPVVFDGPAGTFPDALEIQYRIFDCADTGVSSEIYLENIGLARRINITIAGPREFNLVSARVGSLTFYQQPGVQFRLSLPSSFLRDRVGDTISTEVTMTLEVDRLEPILLHYPTSQRYDIAIKDERGEVVYLWSSTALFAQVASEESVLSREYSVPLDLNLPDGAYQLEAWLTTSAPDRQFAATAQITIVTEGPAAATGKPYIRVRAPR